MNEVSGIDDNYLSSFSDVSEVTSALCIDEDSKHDSSPESTQEIDAISMPLSETSINDVSFCNYELLIFYCTLIFCFMIQITYIK